MRHLIYLFCAITASPALSEVERFETGQFLRITAAYDDDTNRFHSSVAPGERSACFRVDQVRDAEIDLTLVSGTFLPWWSDTTFEPGGFTDTWFNSDTFLENNPGAAPLSQLTRLFSVVPSCDETN